MGVTPWGVPAINGGVNFIFKKDSAEFTKDFGVLIKNKQYNINFNKSRKDDAYGK
mgnify:FL=1